MASVKDTQSDDGRKRRYEHRRDEILDAVADHVVAHGRHDLSLRAAAAAAGISHATLLHHFGSKEILIQEVLQRIGHRAPQAESIDGSVVERLKLLWAHWSAADGVPALALQYETFADALRDRERHHGLLYASAHAYLDPAKSALLAAGCPAGEADTIATDLVATLRGLLLDLVATGDRRRVDTAFSRLLTRIQRELDEWSRPEPPEPDARKPARAKLRAGADLDRSDS